jgi:hypothetical protein
MAQATYDPEIDPSIREAEEEAARQREMTARIRLEIERFVAENDLVPRHKQEEEEEVYTIGFDDESVAPVPPAPKSEKEIRQEEKEALWRQKEAKRAEEKTAKAEEKARRTKNRRQAFQSVISGSFLEGDRVRRALPALGMVAAVMLLYMASLFHLQRLHRNQQKIEKDIRELSVRAVDLAAQRSQQTQRSAIVRQLENNGIPLKEYPRPLKTIEVE